MIDLEIVSYIAIGLGAVVIVLVIWLIVLEMRLKRFMRGKDGGSLEEMMTALINEVERLHNTANDASKHRDAIAEKLRSSMRGISTVRFNPFKDSGGNQSFATAFLNERGDGVVISTLFSRERMSIFAKPINDFASQYDLSKEESKALDQAREQLS